MAWIVRGVSALAAATVIINGGYWEAHHHLWTGATLALFGIVSLVIITGASAAHIDRDQPRVE
ncbi:MAG: hypothetical protein OWU84_10600 [Firmicutes bacterium]|nr:hypothetical protein [Bacillota bacterium]